MNNYLANAPPSKGRKNTAAPSKENKTMAVATTLSPTTVKVMHFRIVYKVLKCYNKMAIAQESPP